MFVICAHLVIETSTFENWSKGGGGGGHTLRHRSYSGGVKMTHVRGPQFSATFCDIISNPFTGVGAFLNVHEGPHGIHCRIRPDEQGIKVWFVCVVTR